MESELIAACVGTHSLLVKNIINEPSLNINWTDERGWTALHYACAATSVRIIEFLLSHPNIDVNKKTKIDGRTPFFIACTGTITPIIKMMLNDPRVMINETDKEGFSPISWLAHNRQIHNIRLIISSGREIDLVGQSEYDITVAHDMYTRASYIQKHAQDADAIIMAHDMYTRASYIRKHAEYTDAITMAHDMRHTKASNVQTILLLRRFRDKPKSTAFEVRVGLGFIEPEIAKFFACVVLYCDGYLEVGDLKKREKEIRKTIKKGNDCSLEGMIQRGRNFRRFLGIVSRLPMEIQMIVCNRACQSLKDTVLSKEFNFALAHVLEMFDDNNSEK